MNQDYTQQATQAPNPIMYSPIANPGQLFGRNNQQQQISDVQNQLAQNRPTQMAAQPQDSGSWWKKLLPTAGSILAPIAAIALAPETAGASLLALGAIGAAGAGAAGGKAAENILEQKDIGQGVAGEAVAGSAGQALGGVVGKGLLKAGGSLASRGAAGATKLAEEKSLQEAAQQTANQGMQKNIIYGEAMRNAPKDLQGKFQTVLDNANRLGIDTGSENAPKLMKEVGYAKTGGTAESGQGAYNELVDRLISSHQGKVNLGNINNELKTAVQTLQETTGGVGELGAYTTKGKTLVPADNPVQRAVRDIANLSPKLSTAGTDKTGLGLAIQQMDLQEANRFAKSLQKMAFAPVKTDKLGNKDLNDVARTKMARDLYQYVRGEVDNAPGLAEKVQALAKDPGLEGFVNSKVGNISDANVRELAKQDILTNLQNAKNMGNLRTPQSEAVDLARLGQHVGEWNTQRTFTAGAQKRATSLAQEAAGVEPSQTQQALSTIGDIFTGGGGKTGASLRAIQAAKESGVAPKVVSTIGKTLQKISPLVPPAAAGLGTLATTLAQPNQTSGMMGVGQGDQTMQPQMQGAQSPLENMLNAAQAQFILAPGQMGQGASSMIGQILPSLQAQAKAQSQLNALMQLYGAAGGGQGFGGNAILNQIATALPFTQQAAAMKQAQGLGTTLGVNPNIGFMQTPETAQTQLGALQSIISGLGGISPGGMPSAMPGAMPNMMPGMAQ